MTFKEAVEMALQYEIRVAGTYLDAVRGSGDPIGRRVFKTLHEEETEHIRFLKEKLAELERAGRVHAGKVESNIPSREKIAAALDHAKDASRMVEPETELRLLRAALKVETETCEFYRKLVREIPPEDSPLFERFVEIEEGHRAIVQAEIDSVSGNGFWFDMPEFRLEAG